MLLSVPSLRLWPHGSRNHSSHRFLRYGQHLKTKRMPPYSPPSSTALLTLSRPAIPRDSVSRSVLSWENSAPLQNSASTALLLPLMPPRAVRTASHSHGITCKNPSWSIRPQKAFSIIPPVRCSRWAGKCSASKFWKTLPGIKSGRSILWMR